MWVCERMGSWVYGGVLGVLFVDVCVYGGTHACVCECAGVWVCGCMGAVSVYGCLGVWAAGANGCG